MVMSLEIMVITSTRKGISCVAGESGGLRELKKMVYGLDRMV
jgi:hypothetical protein